MPEEFEITITAAEPPPAGGTNVMARYAKGMRSGTFSHAAVADAVAALQHQLHQPEPLQSALEQNGALLYQALFAGTVGEALRDALSLAEERQTTVRLRIYSELPALIAIPWEYLYDEPNRRWLALQPEISLVRGLPLSSRAPQPVAGLLRVLVMVASPTDLQPLDSARELASLVAATTTAAIELIPVEPTYGALQAALRQKPHVFHFVGHGFFPADADAAAQGSLVFCRADDGRADTIGADRLVPLLAGCESLGLIMLNACEGAVAGQHSAFAGLAQALLQQNIPAVIAMQAPILDDDAVRFSHEFYAALADGYGVEAAVGEGRKRIHGDAYTWGIPAFYLQAGEPFTIPQLTAGQKADRLWQKSQQIREPAQRRPLLEAALALDDNHAGAQAGLARLEKEEEAARLYAAAKAYIESKTWRAAYRDLEQVERLSPNFADTRSLLAQVKGQIDGVPTYTAQETVQYAHYIPIINALRDGRLVPFLGGDVSRFGRPAGDGWSPGLYPPVAAEAAKALAERLTEQTSASPSLPEISQQTTLSGGPWSLYDGLAELYSADYAPTLFHTLLAELPGRLRAKGYPADPKRRLILFSTAFDELLEQAFAAVEQPYHLFAYHHHADAGAGGEPACFVHINPQGARVPIVAPEHDPNTYQGHAGDDHPVIIKLCGHGVAQDPEQIIVTEDHYLNHLPQEIGALLPSTLLTQLRRSSFLCFGYSLRPWYFRLLWQRLRMQNRRLLDGGWAIVPALTPIEEAFWRDQNIDPIQAFPEGVIAYVNEWLNQLEARV